MKIQGPRFKPKDKYLTNQGYPLGTTCWYYIVEYSGWRKIICGDTVSAAAIRVVRWLREKGE